MAQEVFAQDFSRDSRKAIFESDSLKGIDISYDSFEYVGQNLIARGHVVIQWLDLQVTADNALINLDSNDLEVAGNVTFTSKVVENKTLSLEEYDKLGGHPDEGSTQTTVEVPTIFLPNMSDPSSTVYVRNDYFTLGQGSF